MRHERIVAESRPVRTNADAARLLAGSFAGLSVEELRIVHLDADLRILKLRRHAGGNRAEVAMPLRRVVRDALLLGAANLIVAHNHPGGDPRPSRADKVATRRLAELLRSLDVALVDHLIFADERWYSFRAAGLL